MFVKLIIGLRFDICNNCSYHYLFS